MEMSNNQLVDARHLENMHFPRDHGIIRYEHLTSEARSSEVNRIHTFQLWRTIMSEETSRYAAKWETWTLIPAGAGWAFAVGIIETSGRRRVRVAKGKMKVAGPGDLPITQQLKFNLKPADWKPCTRLRSPTMRQRFCDRLTFAISG